VERVRRRPRTHGPVGLRPSPFLRCNGGEGCMSSRENAHRLTGKELVQQDLMLTRPRRPLAFYMPYLDVT
jgi:hypothetical protein